MDEFLLALHVPSASGSAADQKMDSRFRGNDED